jgi:hypothetical protein
MAPTPRVTKLYVHHEQPPWVFTKRINASRHNVVEDVVREFLTAFETKFAAESPPPPRLTLDSVRVLDEHGAALPLGASIQGTLAEQADVFVCAVKRGVRRSTDPTLPRDSTPAFTAAAEGDLGAQQLPPPAPTTTSTQPEAGTRKEHHSTASQSKQDTGDGTGDGSEVQDEPLAQALYVVMERARSEAEQGNFRAADHMYKQVRLC